MDKEIYNLANAVVTALAKKKMTVSTAESCTGGLVAAAITEISGSSNVFLYGIISYANCVKEQELNVLHSSLEENGAVSEAVAREMAEGVLKKGNADFGISTTGIAGPTGGTEKKPVGTVHIAVASKEKTWHEQLDLGEEQKNDRQAIRLATVKRLLELLLSVI